MHDVPELPEPGQLFRHADGGVYRFVTMAKHAEDGTQMMVYHHVWPFEPDTWVRAANEWPTRFIPMSQSELVEVVAGDRTDAQAAVTLAKATRRATGTQ
jgi:hypothetical protein